MFSCEAQFKIYTRKKGTSESYFRLNALNDAKLTANYFCGKALYSSLISEYISPLFEKFNRFLILPATINMLFKNGFIFNCRY